MTAAYAPSELFQDYPSQGLVTELSKLGIELVTYPDGPQWLVTACRKGKYRDFRCFTHTRERALDFVFLKHGYARNEIVWCRPMLPADPLYR